MTTITLQPITITFTQTSKFSVEDYLEWCEMYDNTPSQKGYKRYVIDAFEDDLRDDINPDNFTFKYGKEKEYEFDDINTNNFTFKYGEEQEYEFEEKEFVPFDYSEYISDLSESEIEEFHKLVEEDKFSINPVYTKEDIIILNSIENPSLEYGLKHDKETGEILCIKKSIYTYHLYEYLRTLD